MKRKLVAIFIVVIGLLVMGLYLLGAGIAEFYSRKIPTFSSIEARDKGVLVSVLNLVHKEGADSQFRYRIKEAWVESIKKVEYKVFLFRTERIVGYRLIIAFDGDFQDTRLTHKECRPKVKVNGAIPLNGITGTSETPIYFQEIQNPFPKEVSISLSCEE